MKLLIFSDIHSNIHALEAMLRKNRDADAIYCAGDLVDFGPFPREVIDCFREHGIQSVQGNHDRNVIACWRRQQRGEMPPVGERDWQDHNAAQLDADAVNYLEKLPGTLSFTDPANETVYGIAHDYGPRSGLENYAIPEGPADFEKFWQAHFASTARPRRLILGHVHRHIVQAVSSDALWISPGSLSYPRPRLPEQAGWYITITDGRVEPRTVAYDTEPLLAAVARACDVRERQAEIVRMFFT